MFYSLTPMVIAATTMGVSAALSAGSSSLAFSLPAAALSLDLALFTLPIRLLSRIISAAESEGQLHLGEVEEKLRPTRYYSRWSTGSSILRLDPCHRSSFDSTKPEALLSRSLRLRLQGMHTVPRRSTLTLPMRRHSIEPAARARRDRCSHDWAHSRQEGFDDGHLVLSCLGTQRLPQPITDMRLAKVKNRPSRLDLVDPLSIRYGLTSVSPLNPKFTAHQRCILVDKELISQPTLIEGMSSLSAHEA